MFIPDSGILYSRIKNMSPLFLTVVGILYLATAWDMWVHDNPGMAVAFVCYAIANFGILWAVMK